MRWLTLVVVAVMVVGHGCNRYERLMLADSSHEKACGLGVSIDDGRGRRYQFSRQQAAALGKRPVNAPR